MQMLAVFVAYCQQYLKTLFTYRLDFIAQYLADLFAQVASVVFILVVFNHTNQIAGWDKGQVLLIYGYFLIPYAVFNAFFSNFFIVPEKYILKGELDRILTRPLNTLFQIIMEQLELESLSGMITGVLVMGYGAWLSEIMLSWTDLILGIALVLGSTLIYGGIYISLASLAFWFEGNIAFMPTVYNISVYGRYPITVYRGVIRFLLTFILPFAFVGFYPAAALANFGEHTVIGYITPIVGFIVFWVGASIWSLGTKRYTGTGS